MYAKIINEQTKQCDVGLTDNIEFFKSIGMTQMDVKQSDIDNQWYLSEYCPMKTDEQKSHEEKERIAHLFLTSADVERGLYKALGKDFDDIIAIASTVEGVDVKALKIELKANNFYRGNPYVSQMGALLGLTEKQLDAFFETGDYKTLIQQEG